MSGCTAHVFVELLEHKGRGFEMHGALREALVSATETKGNRDKVLKTTGGKVTASSPHRTSSHK
jgi:hypothetical protein